ncbi:hypothetical protein MUA02_04440 [Enterobacteriaceae bacterium H20N1]|uniref:Uncharacterized protein n=1 Tax=Dryocola boscaweniae TaxID=2925397 RepID=A0A9X3AMX7_9ENTR|nr:hypothetical protein [Dryocola boscaweniae]MCT4701196.1 hypothetical protein [Dryocola boscaweniae]MCT4718299.1 hypothetical protein [Dryocola boscaweniae]
MSTLTKEWLLQTIADLEKECNAIPGVQNHDANNALEAMKLALSVLEARGELPLPDSPQQGEVDFATKVKAALSGMGDRQK